MNSLFFNKLEMDLTLGSGSSLTHCNIRNCAYNIIVILMLSINRNRQVSLKYFFIFTNFNTF